MEEARAAVKWSRESQSHEVRFVNFFTSLPPEMILRIMFSLGLRDILSCMVVCRAWLQLISAMEPYWKRACVKFGLSCKILGDFLDIHHTCKEVLFACLKHRRTITDYTARPVKLQSTGFASNMSYANQYAKGTQLVGTLHRDFKPHYTLVLAVESDGMQTVLARSPTYPCISQNRIVWAHLFSNQFLIAATGSGIWSVYNIERNHGSLLVQWRIPSPIYDPSIRFACCSKCGMICTAELISAYKKVPFWELKITEMCYNLIPVKRKKEFKLSLPKLTVFTATVGDSEPERYRSNLREKKVTLLSRATDTSKAGMCSSHLLLAQWGNTISGHTLHYRSRESVLQLSSAMARHYHVQCDNYNMAMRHGGLNTEFALSANNSLIGVIFQACLVTWEIDSTPSSPAAPQAASSAADIKLTNYRHEDLRLLALGHLYSVVGLEFSASFLVVHTRTGQLLLECADFAENHYRMMLPFVSFISSEEEDWLSDIAKPCRTKVLYNNKSNRCIEGVELGKPLEC